MSFTTLILIILFAHFFADFVSQSDWMAINKSKRWLPLLTHVGVYTLVLYGFMNCLMIINFVHRDYFNPNIINFILANGLLHLVTDYWTSRLSSYLWAKEDRHNFFVCIGFDQFIHQATLIISASLMLGSLICS